MIVAKAVITAMRHASITRVSYCSRAVNGIFLARFSFVCE